MIHTNTQLWSAMSPSVGFVISNTSPLFFERNIAWSYEKIEQSHSDHTSSVNTYTLCANIRADSKFALRWSKNLWIAFNWSSKALKLSSVPENIASTLSLLWLWAFDSEFLTSIHIKCGSSYQSIDIFVIYSQRALIRRLSFMLIDFGVT